MIRGATVVVVDLGILLGSGSGEDKQARVVTLRVGSRIVGLAVDSIIGVREFERRFCPTFRRCCCRLIRRCSPRWGLLDRELLMVLDGSRIITEQELEAAGGFTMRTDAAIGEANVMRFAELIEERLGLRIDGSSLNELEAILRARACIAAMRQRRRLPASARVRVSMHDELRELAAKLTIGETYFLPQPRATHRVFRGRPAVADPRSRPAANPDIVRRMFHR